jgi:hypothetical protein
VMPRAVGPVRGGQGIQGKINPQGDYQA